MRNGGDIIVAQLAYKIGALPLPTLSCIEGASDKSVLSSERGHASVHDSLRAVAVCVIAAYMGYLNVALGDRCSQVVAISGNGRKGKARWLSQRRASVKVLPGAF